MSEDAVTRFEAVLQDVEGQYQAAFEAADNEQALREANARFVGPSGALTNVMKTMREIPKDKKKELGQAANAVKGAVAKLFDARLADMARADREAELSGPMLDFSLPGRRPAAGRLHPVTRVKHELLDIFASLGFEQADGPEVDLFENCFEKLGFPPDHPATDEQDTFFIEGEGERVLLRTHTSTIQVREMSRREPPLAIVGPGAVFRRDDDSTHSPMFHQLEGFLVDEDVSFADLKGVLTLFLERLLGEDIEVRFRASYFPFVEPGAEVDVRRKGETRWMEILGCGMIHPVVLENVGYDSGKYSGFAFGMGLDRIAMVRYGIQNIKLLYDNDVRFLGSF